MATDAELLINTKNFLDSDRNKSTDQQVLDFEGKPIRVGYCYFIRSVVGGVFKHQRIIGNVLVYMKKRSMKPQECMLIPQTWFEKQQNFQRN